MKNSTTIEKKRIHPFRDDKILASWNGLMIAALAIGGRVLKEVEYIVAAEKAVNFNKTTAYVCENFSCKAPVNDIEELIALL